jgi:pilus assembly protein TadC
MGELQLAKLRGEVREVSDIKRGGFDIARELRDALDSSVNTLAAELAPLDSADACAQVLRRHNRAIQDLLAKGLREKLSVKVDAE